MSATINIVETTTELGIEVVEVVVESASTPGPSGPGVPAGGTTGQSLVKASDTDYDTEWDDVAGGGGGAPTDATYLVTTAHGDLSAEVVVGATPGGELGGTWASPTVDASHSGSTHTAVQAAAEATAASELATHSADTTSVHGIADTSALALTANHPSNATFNDHSARHEDGGADEISLAGLSGTPADLQTHLDDAADAHDASAISFLASGPITSPDVQNAIVDVANLAILDSLLTTKGDVVGRNATIPARVPAGIDDHLLTADSTQATGLKYSQAQTASIADGAVTAAKVAADVATQAELDAHVNDASDAHDASAISVADVAGDYTATDVEGVLAEIAPQLGGSVSDPVQELFGTAATVFEFQSSSLAGLTAIGTPDTEDADTTIPDCYFVKETNTAIGWNGRYLASPATPWTAITRIQGSNGDRANQKTFLAFASDSAGAPAACDVWMLAGISRSLILERWTNPTTFGSTILAAFLQDIEAPMFLALRVNSTSDVDFLWSPDGWVWREVVGARNPGLTIAYLGIGVSCQQAASISISAAFDYLRIFGSALAFPGAP